MLCSNGPQEGQRGNILWGYFSSVPKRVKKYQLCTDYEHELIDVCCNCHENSSQRFVASSTGETLQLPNCCWVWMSQSAVISPETWPTICILLLSTFLQPSGWFRLQSSSTKCVEFPDSMKCEMRCRGDTVYLTRPGIHVGQYITTVKPRCYCGQEMVSPPPAASPDFV